MSVWVWRTKTNVAAPKKMWTVKAKRILADLCLCTTSKAWVMKFSFRQHMWGKATKNKLRFSLLLDTIIREREVGLHYTVVWRLMAAQMALQKVTRLALVISFSLWWYFLPLLIGFTQLKTLLRNPQSCKVWLAWGNFLSTNRYIGTSYHQLIVQHHSAQVPGGNKRNCARSYGHSVSTRTCLSMKL